MEGELPIKKKRGRKPKNKDTENNSEKNNSDEQIVNTSEQIVNQQKKRGRKPKIKEPTDGEEVKKVPGKRGRKPKIKDETEIVKIPKRRGRKPKEKVYGVIQNSKKNIGSENIIIHLPIKTENIKNNLKENELLTYNPELNCPKPFESNIAGDNVDNFQFISQNNNPNLGDELKGEGPPPNTNFCQYPFDEKVNSIFEVLEDNNDIKSEESVENLNKLADEFNIEHNKDWFNNKDDLVYKSQGVDKMIDIIKKNRDIDKEQFSIKNNRSNVEKCLIQFAESNKNKSWPSSTSIYCWWCCHPFEGPPCALPCDYSNNVFKVWGVFCSPECAAAYNFNDIHSGYDLWERYSLLNYLYRKIYNNNNIKIKLAPPKQTLKIFGGNLSIKEFRIQNTNYNNIYKIIMPPLISITPIQELTGIDNGYSSKNEKKVFMIEKEKIGDSNLKLQRSKPFNNSKNTLEKCMLQSNQSYESESNISIHENDDLSNYSD